MGKKKLDQQAEQTIDNEIKLLKGPQLACKLMELKSYSYHSLPHPNDMTSGQSAVFCLRLQYLHELARTGMSDPVYERLVFTAYNLDELYWLLRIEKLLASNWTARNDEAKTLGEDGFTPRPQSPFSGDYTIFFEHHYPAFKITPADELSEIVCTGPF